MSAYTQGLRDGREQMREVHRDRLRVLLEAAGMDPLRDWDDLINAVRCQFKQPQPDLRPPTSDD